MCKHWLQTNKTNAALRLDSSSLRIPMALVGPYIYGTMQFRALCYLISSCAGDMVAQCGSAHYGGHEMTTLCRLLADALGGPHTSVLELGNLRLVVHSFKGFVAAAVIPADTQVAEAAFEVHLLAVLFQLGTLQSGSVQLYPAANRLFVSGSSIAIERLRSYQKFAMKGLSLVLQTPGVCFAELVTIDVRDDCCHITSLLADGCAPDSHALASELLGPAVHTACRSLRNVLQVCLLRNSSSAATNHQQNTIEGQGGQTTFSGGQTTFSAIWVGCGQQAPHQVAVIKCLQVLDLCMFILVWSDEHVLRLVAQHRLAVKPHVRIGKAAVPSDLRFKLNAAATTLKKGLYGYE